MLEEVGRKLNFSTVQEQLRWRDSLSGDPGERVQEARGGHVLCTEVELNQVPILAAL